jgi:hypothetical protein
MLIKPVLKVSLQRAMFLVENLSDRLALALWEHTHGFDNTWQQEYPRCCYGARART